jgi:polysaccharide export outer membrane protein
MFSFQVRRVAVAALVASSALNAGCAGLDPFAPVAQIVDAVDPTPIRVKAGPDMPPWGAPTVVVEEDDGGPYKLDSGDRLRIFVYGQPNLSRLYTVDSEGRIFVPLIGEVQVRGSTTKGVSRTITRRLGTQFVKDPQVTVDIAQYRPFFILGEVRNAGQYPYVSGLTVQAAVAIAGGYADRANERAVRITRKHDGLVEKMDVPPDYVIRPGDEIYVYERWF